MEVLRQRQQRVSTPRRLAPHPGDRKRQQALAGLPSMPYTTYNESNWGYEATRKLSAACPHAAQGLMTPCVDPMALSSTASERVTIDGKFLRLGERKFYVKGVTYGPFAPDAKGETFGSLAQVVRDFQQIRELGANLLRVYYVPPKWFLDLAAEQGLRLFIDVPWPTHLCFMESYEVQQEARAAVRRAVADCKGHPAVFALSVANEIPAEIVRW